MSGLCRGEIVLVGAGGHARVVLEILRERGMSVAFCVARPDAPSVCLGVEVLTADDALPALFRDGYRTAVVAVGDNRLRTRLAEQVRAAGFVLTTALHPRSTISSSALIGSGVVVMAGAVINAEASIGDLVIINTGASIDHDCHIGRGVHVAPQCGVAGNVHIGEHTLLGIGARVVPGVTIGSNVIVGAGAVVVGDIEDGVTVVGVPARPIAARAGS